MIAYNHYIKFVPELKNDKTVKGSFVDTVTIKKSDIEDLEKNYKYEMTFFNNQGRDLTLYADREFARTKPGQFWAFEVKDVVTFFWHSGELVLSYIPQKLFTPALLEYWSLHTVLPIFFTIEESYDFLHAGAVEAAGKPILFVAESFGGKSTMTDFFMKQGHTMVSDDKVAAYENDGSFFAIPSHPHHRPHRAMEDLGFFVQNIASKHKPVHAIYELEKSDADAKIEITQINGVEKFRSLRHASEMNLFFLKAKRFEFLMKMANVVPVYKVTVPWNLKRLEEVYGFICQHSEGFE